MGKIIIRKKLVKKQVGRMHASPSGLTKICCKRGRSEGSEPVCSIKVHCNSSLNASNCTLLDWKHLSVAFPHIKADVVFHKD